MPDISSRRPRRSGPAWLGPIAARLTPTVKALLIADVSIYLFYVLVRQSRPFMEEHLAIGPRFWAGELWQPLTSLFVHLDFLGFLFSMIGLWFVGSFVERTQGTRKCAALFFIAGIAANLAIAGVFRLRGLAPVSYDDGCVFGVVALFVAFARIFGRQPVGLWLTNLSIQARYLVVILLGWQAAASLARGRWDSIAALAVAIAVGYFGAAAGGLSELRTFFAHARDVAKARRLRRRFGVIDGGDRPSKKYVN
jgi:membrane associated rhomboid family serine protease